MAFVGRQAAVRRAGAGHVAEGVAARAAGPDARNFRPPLAYKGARHEISPLTVGCSFFLAEAA
jgi:hypothetical protein